MILRLFLSMLACCGVYSTHAAGTDSGLSLTSRWAEELLQTTPLPEYPRPLLVRERWLNLNGAWDFKGEGEMPPELPQQFPEQAWVPSVTQASTSGVAADYERGWYRKEVQIPDDWAGQKVRLHCEAIGTKSTVFWDGKPLGRHVGGFERVSYELPECLPGKAHELLIYFDDTDARMPRGKAERMSGLWQTVWIEPVPQEYVISFKQTPDIDASRHVVEVTASNLDLSIRLSALDAGKVVATAQGRCGQAIELLIPEAKLWSPESPFLYDLTIELVDGETTVDRVDSYFGMRKISRGEVNGVPRILLNNEVYFQTGLLEHGRWPGSLWTHPSDTALKWEIQTAKTMGFNTIRTHLKIEPERWYYWCDRLGMLIWQDAPRQNEFVHKAHESDEDKQLMRDSVSDMVRQLYNHPSIISWVIFNEANAQFEAREMTVMTRQLDASRLINTTSHVWIQDEVKRTWREVQRRYNTDYYDAHCYERELKFYDFDCHLPAVFGEYGGIGYMIEGHTKVSDRKPYGYGAMVHTGDELVAEFEKLVDQAVVMRDTEHLCAIIYTELIDYKEEVNGFITADRKVVKVDTDQMRAINMRFRKLEESE